MLSLALLLQSVLSAKNSCYVSHRRPAPAQQSPSIPQVPPAEEPKTVAVRKPRSRPSVPPALPPAPPVPPTEPPAEQAPAPKPAPRQPQNVNTGRLTYYTFGPSGIAYCDGKHYGDDEHIVALSTAYMPGRQNCHKRIRLNVEGKSIEARVVDMCDENHGCKRGTVDGTPGLWKSLGLNMDRGVIDGVTWSFI